MDEILTDTTTLSQSGSRSNGNEGVLYTVKVPQLEPYQHTQFNVITRTPFFERRSYPTAADTVSIF